ncbi:MAG: YicC family protein [Comamonadaceae bacterium]|nr:YicC family protein [Comamonadaceae bacterium]
MAVYSMTGFACAQHSGGSTTADTDHKISTGGRLGIEIRSVNSRYLDLSFRLPEELRSFEPFLRERLGAKLTRGKVEVRAAFENAAQIQIAEPSTRLLQRLNAIQDNVKAWLPDARALSVAEVIDLSASDQTSQRDWQPAVVELTETALNALMSAREREGARLALMLLNRIAQLRSLATQAAPLIPQLVAQQRQRFLDRWADAMQLTEGQAMPDMVNERALAEATAFAIRIDVAEELTRLASHLDELERLIKNGGEIGKRLDFLIQELHREANTLGSKSAALELTHISVDMKVLIEQMREQVQNIE